MSQTPGSDPILNILQCLFWSRSRREYLGREKYWHCSSLQSADAVRHQAQQQTAWCDRCLDGPCLTALMNSWFASLPVSVVAAQLAAQGPAKTPHHDLRRCVRGLCGNSKAARWLRSLRAAHGEQHAQAGRLGIRARRASPQRYINNAIVQVGDSCCSLSSASTC